MSKQLLTTVGLLCLLAVVLTAAVPQKLSYQAILTDAGGLPVTSATQVIFTIWDAETSGTALWAETLMVSPSATGNFSQILGEVHAITEELLTGDAPRYLGVQVGTDDEMIPRIELVSGTYAMRVATVDGASGGEITGDVFLQGGRVGIGTDSPLAKLDVRGKALVQSLQTYKDSELGGTISKQTRWLGLEGYGQSHTGGAIYVGDSVTDHSIILRTRTNDDSSAVYVQRHNEGVIAYFQGDGKVGIGLDTPSVRLDINGTARMTGFEMPTGASDTYILTSDSAGNGTWQLNTGGSGGGWQDDGTVVRLETSTDSVGIGTSTPGDLLEVFGDGEAGITLKSGPGDPPPYLSIKNPDNANSSVLTARDGHAFDIEYPAGSQVMRLETNGTFKVGKTNHVDGVAAFAAGKNDTARADYTTVSGGLNNRAYGEYASIGGGHGNRAYVSNTTVAGGTENWARGTNSSIGGGESNYAYTDATVAGGKSDTAEGNASSIGGGTNNFAYGTGATIAGGGDNDATKDYTTVGGGRYNNAGGYEYDSEGKFGAVGGGEGNSAGGNHSTIGGGKSNAIWSSGGYSTIPGGTGNMVSNSYSLAAGYHAWAFHSGTFVWADASDTAHFTSTADDQFLIRAQGGVGIGVDSPTVALDVDGNIHLGSEVGPAELEVAGPLGTANVRLGANPSFDDFGAITLHDADNVERTRMEVSGSQFGVYKSFGRNGSTNIELSGLSGGFANNGKIWACDTAGDPRAVVLVDIHQAGRAAVLGPNGTINVALEADATNANRGTISVNDESGDSRVEIGHMSDGSGYMLLRSGGGSTNVKLSHYNTTSYPWCGRIGVYDGSSVAQAGLYVDHSGDGIVWGDTKSFRKANPEQPGTDIWYTCPEGPEAAAYVRGTAHLVRGRAEVNLPSHFTTVASSEGITVQLTPLSASSKGLAAVEKRNNRFVVQELYDGDGTYDFDYTVMAVRKGKENYAVIRPAMESDAGVTVKEE